MIGEIGQRSKALLPISPSSPSVAQGEFLCDNRQLNQRRPMNENVSTLNCPACGAALDLDGSSVVLRCKFCGNVIQISGAVPSQPAALPPASRRSANWPGVES